MVLKVQLLDALSKADFTSIDNCEIDTYDTPTSDTVSITIDMNEDGETTWLFTSQEITIDRLGYAKVVDTEGEPCKLYFTKCVPLEAVDFQ